MPGMLDIQQLYLVEDNLPGLVDEINIRIRQINDWARLGMELGPVYMSEDGITSNHRYLQQGPLTITTTDATTTTLDTIAIVASRTYFIHTIVLARRTGGSGTADDGCVFKFQNAYQTVSGTVTKFTDLTGFAPLEYSSGSRPSWKAVHTISGTDVLVQVTGDASTNITWLGRTTVEWIDS